MTQPLLQVQNLSFSYSPDKPTLRNISLSLEAGKILALLGPNGSGKSTLLKLLIAHLSPNSGSITLDSQPLHKIPRRQLARKLAYLPQTPSHDPAHTVLDHLRLGRAPYLPLLGLESQHDLDLIQKTSQLLDLADFLHRPIDHLSGGQRQRVFVARCLIQEPRILLLDEPGTFLDLQHQVDLLKLLKQLAKEQNLSILLASHDLNTSAHFADELILLHHGAIAAQGPPDKVLLPNILTPIYGLPLSRLETPTGPIIFPHL
jgi:iron complex transport system ATP-binding protein